MTYTDNTPDTPRNRGDYTAPHLSPVSPEEDARTILLNRVTWSAVFSGVAISLAAQLVLNLLGVGIGAATIDPLKSSSPSPEALSMGALVWWTVSGIIAAFLGGVAAGRTAGEPRESTAGWHGLTSWAASVIVIALAITMGAGSVIGGAMNLAGMPVMNKVANGGGGSMNSILPGAGGAMGSNASGINGYNNGVNGINGNGMGASNPNANLSNSGTAPTAGEGMAPTNPAREAAAQKLAQSKGITIEQARLQVDQSADVTAKNVSRGALLTVVALLLGALAAWFGGRAGAVKPTITSLRLRQEQLH